MAFRRGGWLLLLIAACGGPGEKGPIGTEEAALCEGPAASTVPGIDVSDDQHTINWSAAAGSGIKWAYAKATQGNYYVASTFRANWAGMQGAGVLRGAYHFFDPGVNGTAQADYYLSEVGGFGAGNLPPMLDWEVSYGVSGLTASQNAQAFINEIAARTGLQTIIYTAPGIWDGLGTTPTFGGAPLWEADYTYCLSGCCATIPNGWSHFIMWQWSDNGSVPGVPATVDLDIFNGTLAQLQAMAGVNACTPSCDGNVLTSGNCTKGDCADYAATCVDDNLGARCVSDLCGSHAQGTAEVCWYDGQHLASCNNGAAAEGGDCATYGATCVNDSLGGHCVFGACPADGPGAYCYSSTTVASCNNGSVSFGDCADFGASCVDDSQGTRCVFEACPATGTAKYCSNSTTIASCNNGAVSFGDCADFGSTCVNDSLGARCVFSSCPADGTAKFCENSTTIGSCDNGAVTFGDCANYGATCVDDNLGARCVFSGCPAQGTADICLSNGDLGICDNGALTAVACSTLGMSLVCTGGAYCEGADGGIYTGIASDGGVTLVDAGIDAGAEGDAGMDAGHRAPDAGREDAGGSGLPTPDAGPAEQPHVLPTSQGCGCSTQGPGSLSAGLLLAIGLTLTRRRRLL